MRLFTGFFSILIFFSAVGCTAQNSDLQKPPATKRLPVSYALPGTTTAVVGIAVGKDGIPQETVREIVLLPGQKVLFAGPDRFQIVFKQKKSPNNIIRQDSKDGTIVVKIPKDILRRGEFVEEFKRNKFVRFDYSIIVNGKELDPPLIIKQDI